MFDQPQDAQVVTHDRVGRQRFKAEVKAARRVQDPHDVLIRVGKRRQTGKYRAMRAAVMLNTDMADSML